MKPNLYYFLSCYTCIVLKKSFYTTLMYSIEKKFPVKLIKIKLVNEGQLII